MKKLLSLTLIALLVFSMTACGGVKQEDFDAVQSDLSVAMAERDTAIAERDTAIAERDVAIADTAVIKAELEATLDTLNELTEAHEQSLIENQSLTEKLTTSETALSEKTTELAEVLAVATALEVESNAVAESVPVATPQPVSSTVYIPKSGSKYHSRASCSNMKNPSEVSESSAISLGYSKCSKCW